MCRMGTYTPSLLQCVHFRNLYLPRFRVHATRLLCVFWYSWTRLLLSGYRCAQLATDRSSLLSFLLGEFARQRLVSVLALDSTVSVQLYLVDSSIVSVIASWLPKVPP